MESPPPAGRRGRALAFAATAALCAGLAASATGGYRAELGEQLGELAPVLVTTRALEGKRALAPSELRDAVEVRRVPERFLPPGALTAAEQLVGRTLTAPIPSGSYVFAHQLRTGPGRPSRPALDPGTRPVEIVVDAAARLAGRPGEGRVDVVVTSEPGPSGAGGRTYVAVRAAQLLALTAAGDPGGEDLVPGPAPAAWTATLALTRTEALRLIEAESFARSVRLLAR